MAIIYQICIRTMELSMDLLSTQKTTKSFQNNKLTIKKMLIDRISNCSSLNSFSIKINYQILVNSSHQLRDIIGLIKKIKSTFQSVLKVCLIITIAVAILKH